MYFEQIASQYLWCFDREILVLIFFVIVSDLIYVHILFFLYVTCIENSFILLNIYINKLDIFLPNNIIFRVNIFYMFVFKGFFMPKVNKTEIRVIYADTDQMGVVYHGNYMRFFEIGRTELLRMLGISYKELEAYGVMLPVKEVFVDYKLPVKYDDVITVHSCIDKLKHASLKIKYEIYNGDILCTTGYTLHPFVNMEGKVIHPEEFLYNVISKGE